MILTFGGGGLAAAGLLQGFLLAFDLIFSLFLGPVLLVMALHTWVNARRAAPLRIFERGIEIPQSLLDGEHRFVPIEYIRSIKDERGGFASFDCHAIVGETRTPIGAPGLADAVATLRAQIEARHGHEPPELRGPSLRFASPRTERALFHVAYAIGAATGTVAAIRFAHAASPAVFLLTLDWSVSFATMIAILALLYFGRDKRFYMPLRFSLKGPAIKLCVSFALISAGSAAAMATAVVPADDAVQAWWAAAFLACLVLIAMAWTRRKDRAAEAGRAAEAAVYSPPTLRVTEPPASERQP